LQENYIGEEEKEDDQVNPVTESALTKSHQDNMKKHYGERNSIGKLCRVYKRLSDKLPEQEEAWNRKQDNT